MAGAVDLRLRALRRFATAITVLTIFGHALLGFEPAVVHVFASLGTAYGVELLLEMIDARARRRRPAFAGGVRSLVDFLLPAHISGLAVAMLLYPNARILPIVFASAAAIASKTIFRVTVRGRSRHFLNPSNAGIAATLLLFPWVGIAPPYQFTENVGGFWDGAIPAIVILTGSLLNATLTRRIPLILAWLIGFALQALVRAWILDTPAVAGLSPMTGMAFLLFTFYMAPDPGTTPVGTAGQIAFGVGTAAVYGMLMALHIVFGLFFSLLIVCATRGAFLWALAWRGQRARATAIVAPAPAGAVP